MQQRGTYVRRSGPISALPAEPMGGGGQRYVRAGRQAPALGSRRRDAPGLLLLAGPRHPEAASGAARGQGDSVTRPPFGSSGAWQSLRHLLSRHFHPVYMETTRQALNQCNARTVLNAGVRTYTKPQHIRHA